MNQTLSRLCGLICLLALMAPGPDAAGAAAGNRAAQGAKTEAAGGKSGASGAKAEAAGPKKVPTTINSGRMDYDANAQVVFFVGSVHVKRPDFELWADKMTLYLDKSGQGSSAANANPDSAGMDAGNIDHIVAEGNVRMKSEDRQGSCKKATYYAKADKIVMEGSPVLKDGKQSTIVGNTITHYLGANKSEVHSPEITFWAPDKTEGPRKSGPVLEAP